MRNNGHIVLSETPIDIMGTSWYNVYREGNKGLDLSDERTVHNENGNKKGNERNGTRGAYCDLNKVLTVFKMISVCVVAVFGYKQIAVGVPTDIEQFTKLRFWDIVLLYRLSPSCTCGVEF